MSTRVTKTYIACTKKVTLVTNGKSTFRALLILIKCFSFINFFFYLDFPDSGEREDEAAADGDGVDDVDDDEKIPQAPSIVRRQKCVQQNTLETQRKSKDHI